jgi:hypothetical protein
MNKIHNVQHINFQGNILFLKVDNKDYEIDITTQSSKLTKCTESQRNNFKVSPSGYGIHWPEIDEDLSVDTLIGVKHQYPNKELV